MNKITRFLFLFLLGITANAQQITGQVIDVQTNKSVPFATIKIGNTELISNDNGYFTFSEKQVINKSLISVSSIGYAAKNSYVSDLKSNHNIIYLTPVAYNFEGVYISNEQPDPYQIMKLVNNSLSKNYTTKSYKNTFFSRSTFTFKPKKTEVKIKKSTGISKSDLAKINKETQGFTNKMMNEQAQEYTEQLFDFYKITSQKDGKRKVKYKVGMQKSVLLKDESKATNFNDLEEKATNFFTKLIDTTKFYRIKSGFFGSRDTISFRKEYNENHNNLNVKKEKKDSFKINSTRSGFLRALAENSITQKAKLDFVYNHESYTYTYVETTYLNDDLVYVVDFKPKKNEAKFTGKLYINQVDYAVLRADYRLADGKKLKSLNLKLLFGLKFVQNVCSGTIIFRKIFHTNTYHHYYFSQEQGSYFYVNRPVKFIELARKNKSVVAFDFKIEGNTIEKVEFLNVGWQTVSESEFDLFEEPDFSTQTINKYDPEIWKGYNIIEPLEEMKKFKSVE